MGDIYCLESRCSRPAHRSAGRRNDTSDAGWRDAPPAAANIIDLGEYATWLDAERVVVNVYQRYRELDPATTRLVTLALLVMQAEWLAKH